MGELGKEILNFRERMYYRDFLIFFYFPRPINYKNIKLARSHAPCHVGTVFDEQRIVLELLIHELCFLRTNKNKFRIYKWKQAAV
jgi:hypothetical protein